MICFENILQLLFFVCVWVLHIAKTEYDENGVHDEIDALPIPKEKLFQGHLEVFQKVKRSLGDDTLDGVDGVDSRSYAARYVPREFFQKQSQCNYDEILKLRKKCACYMPRKKCVRINNPHGTVLTTMPECVIVDRCEGICPFSTNCVPKETKLIDLKVIVTHIVPDGSGSENSMKISYECRTIQVEKHVKCGCACEVSEKDCSPDQVFRPQQCQCQCPNATAAEECTKQNREWDPLLCECSCPSNISRECSTGAFFHKTQCKCVAARTEKAWRRSGRRL